MGAPTAIELHPEGAWNPGSTCGEWSPDHSSCGCGSGGGGACGCEKSCGCEADPSGTRPAPVLGEVSWQADVDGAIWDSATAAIIDNDWWVENAGTNWFGTPQSEATSGYCTTDSQQQGQVVEAKGICGAIIDDWIEDEIREQFKGWTKWVQANGGASIEDYLKWANGNQRYKDSDFFEFSKDTKCGTKDDGADVGCGRSVTLCGKCVRSSILGNIMYGLVGSLPIVLKGGTRVGKFSIKDLLKASDTKRSWGMTVDKFDELAYAAGAQMYGGLEDSFDICALLEEALKDHPDSLCELRKDGGKNDLSKCRPCTEKTKEKRHGGNDSPRRRP